MDYCDIEWFALETNRVHSVVFEIASKYCISDSFVDHDGYSISSEGFLPTVKDLHDPDNHDGMITHLEPDILECEVKWALESITTNKASGGDGIPVELFQIQKDEAVKVLPSIYQLIWKTQQWPQDWKKSVFIPIPKKGTAKECSNYHTVPLISHASKVMLQIFQARLQQYVNQEHRDVQAGFRKGRGTRDQIGNICWIIEIARELKKNLLH